MWHRPPGRCASAYHRSPDRCPRSSSCSALESARLQQLNRIRQRAGCAPYPCALSFLLAFSTIPASHNVSRKPREKQSILGIVYISSQLKGPLMTRFPWIVLSASLFTAAAGAQTELYISEYAFQAAQMSAV